MATKGTSFKKVTFIIPKFDNDGRDLSAERVELESDLTRQLNGWTRSEVAGEWRDEVWTTYRDQSWAYFVLIEDNEQGDHFLTILKRCLSDFKRKTRQETIYLDVATGVKVDFV